MVWDDDAHLTAEGLRSGHGLFRIWFEVGATQQYYPLTHSTFWVFHRLWGFQPLGYHFANIVLHATSAWLLAIVMVRLQVPGAILAATVFALHPVHVESVAWMTELKNTLSTAFCLCAALAYLRFDRTRDARWYAGSLLLFVAALLSKTVTAVLPAALLVILWWRDGRVAKDRIRPLLPFFAAAVSAGLLTSWFERSLLAAQGAEFALTPLQRLLLATRAVWFYASKLLLPADLMFIYPRWQLDPSSVTAWLYAVALAAALAWAWTIRRRSRGQLAAGFLYCGLLFPALGFVNVYPFRYSFVADHFQYLASLSFIAAVSAAVVIAARRVRADASRVELIAADVLGLGLGVLTSRQARDYRDSDTLFRATLARNPECWLCYNNLATAGLHGSEAEFNQAAEYVRRAVALNPNSAEAHNNLGGVFQRQGRVDEALKEHLEAARLNPRLVDARYNVAVAYQALGKPQEAEHAYVELLRERPDFGPAHANLAALLLSSGRPQEAIPHFADALRLLPGDWQLQSGLGAAYFGIGDTARGLAAFRNAVRLNPNSAEVHHDLGVALANTGQFEEAAAEFEAALRLRPDLDEARTNLARIRAMIKR
jgi:tetratricopeptide (TPR) repeat protein